MAKISKNEHCRVLNSVVDAGQLKPTTAGSCRQELQTGEKPELAKSAVGQQNTEIPTEQLKPSHESDGTVGSPGVMTSGEPHQGLANHEVGLGQRPLSLPAGFEEEIKRYVDQAVTALRDDIRNLHIEILRQNHIHQVSYFN